MQQIKCPLCEHDDGIVEVASKIYFNVGGKAEHLPGEPEPRIIIEEIEYDESTNDSLGGMPFNMESELSVICSACGEEFAWSLGDDLLKSVDMQSERVFQEAGKLTGIDKLDAMDPDERRKWTLRIAIMQIQPNESVEFPSGLRVGFMHADMPLRQGSMWWVEDADSRYFYGYIDAIIDNHDLIGE